MTFAGDTASAGTGKFDTARGFEVEWFLASGSDRTGGSVPTSWGTMAQTNRNAGSTISIGDSTSDTWQITGVQLEVGSTATDFEHRSYGEELALCQRYYYHSGYNGGTPYGGGSLCFVAFNASEAAGTNLFPVTMRASPTVNIKDAAGNVGGIHRAGTGNITSGVAPTWTGNADNNTKGIGGITKSSAWATGNVLIGGFQADAEL